MKQSRLDSRDCAREPIHIPGRIQPNGFLLACHGESLEIKRVSENFSLSGSSGISVMGKNLEQVLPPEIFSSISRALQGGSKLELPRRLPSSTVEGHNFDVVIHRSGPELLVELEEFREPTSQSFSSIYQAVNEAIEKIFAAEDLGNLWEVAVAEAKRLSGYDRVMLYKFDDEWNGRVIAEAKEDSLEPFLDLHFPASDIPAQARALYLRNWLRYIPDVSYVPVEILDQEGTPPVDLSFAILRSVSPVHLQYLKNMGVGASMSVSVIREGKLWGLIAFHHASSRFLPFELRQSLEFLGKFFSLQISAKQKTEDKAYRVRLENIRNGIEERMQSAPDFFAILTAKDSKLLELAHGSTGAMVIHREHIFTTGNVPPTSETGRLVSWLKKNVGKMPIFSSENLSGLLPWDEQLSKIASGLLAISIPEAEPAYVIWLKPEVVQTIRWAGNPDKTLVQSGTTAPLTPRSSFAAWQENLRHMSLPWLSEQRSEIEQLRRSIIELDLERQVKTVSSSNVELELFAGAVAHDLKEPLRGIEAFAGFLQQDLTGIDSGSKETIASIKNLAKRARLLIAELYSYSKIGRTELAVEEVDLNEVVELAKASLTHQIQESNARIEVPRSLPLVRCDRVRVQQVFQNLISNSLKYNLQSDKLVRVEVETNQNGLAISVSDNGIGIPEADRERIFILFQRLHSPEAFGGGTGMGLAIAKRVVEKHSGRIWVEGNGAMGSKIKFTLAPTPA